MAWSDPSIRSLVGGSAGLDGTIPARRYEPRGLMTRRDPLQAETDDYVVVGLDNRRRS